VPLYEIKTKGEDKLRLVEADSSAQAVRHCAQGRYEARTISKPAEIAKLMSGGVVLETAGEEPAKPESEQK
jgi:hypothetical protein